MVLPQNAAPAPSTVARSEAGFSVIEGLIAALLLLVVTLGILPLFSRAMNNNIKGNDSTRQANSAVDTFETAVALLFNSGAKNIPDDETSLVVTETLALKRIASATGGEDQAMSNRWELPADLAVGDVPVMTRQTTVQQYSLDDYTDNQILNNPLQGDVEARLVHLKTFDVVLQDATANGSQPYRARLYQAY